MRITKKMEAKEDLKRYQKLLPNIEDLEDRNFFISGIISIDNKYRGNKLGSKVKEGYTLWNMYQTIEDSHYSYQAIADLCGVNLKDIENLLKGNFPETKILKRIYIGIQSYDI